MFMSYKFTVLHGGINAGSYELVFDGDLPAQTAEDVFRIFNLKHPNGYRGRSMSVSDARCNDAIGQGLTEIILTADDLPTRESWENVCLELQRAGLEDAVCIAEGIKINLSH